MKFKRKLTKAEFEALTEAQQQLYIADGESYVLNIEDTAFETLKAEKKSAEEKLAKYEQEEAERIAAAEERAKKKAEEDYKKALKDKDVDSIINSWQEKHKQEEDARKAAEEKYNQFVKKSVIDSETARIANAISTAPDIILPHIKNRLDVDLSSGEPKLFVLDKQGQRSALTVDELSKEFVDNPSFSAIIKASSANSGASNRPFDFSGAKNENGKPKRVGELSNQELGRIAREAVQRNQSNED